MDARKQYNTVTANEVIDGRHPPVIMPMVAKDDQGIIPLGCVLAKDSDGKIVPYAVVTADMTGLVNGTNKAFTHTATAIPLQPNSVVVTHGEITLQDNGFGVIGGTGGSGTVNYKTGAVAVTFTDAPADESASPEVVVARAVVGIATRSADTSKEDVISVLIHGTALKELVVIGVGASVLTTGANDALAKLGIYTTF
mgnify:CR=1 FL=1